MTGPTPYGPPPSPGGYGKERTHMFTVEATLIEVLTQDIGPAPKDVTPIDTYTDRAVFNAGLVLDGAGHLLEGYSTLQGNTTVVRLWRVDHLTGARTPVADVAPPPGFKIDSATLAQSGANLLIGLTCHEAISSPTRRNIYARAVVPGVAVPYPGGAEPRGAYIDPALLGGGDPMPTPIDPTELAAAVAVRLISDAAYGNLIQQRAKNGAREAITVEGAGMPAYLRTADSLLDTLKNGLYAWMQDRIYETVLKFLDPKAGRK